MQLGAEHGAASLVRVAVVGAGRMGQVHCRIVAENPGAALVAIIDPVEAVGTRAAQDWRSAWYAGVEEALAAQPIDAFVVAVPDRLHVGVTTDILAAGKHVLVEKPLADTFEGALQIAAAAEKSSGRILVGHVLRHDPRYRVAAQTVANGDIGDPVHFRASRIVPRSVGIANHGLSPIYMYQGIHDIDLVQWIAGSPIVEVCATTAAKILPAAGVPGVDVSVALLKLANGAVGTLEISWALPDATPSGLQSAFELYGTNGTVKIDVTTQGVELLSDDTFSYPDTVLSPEIDERLEGVVPQQFEHFLDMIRYGLPSRVSVSDAVAATTVLDALTESLDNAGWAAVRSSV
ncbi:MAG TPA: Gfo/Idh/MocA family oxidoreductase [Gryllotalpicola sp.]